MSNGTDAISYIRLRIGVLLVFFVCGYGGLYYRLFNVQYLKNNRYVAQARHQQSLRLVLPAQRGQIVDRNDKILAISVPAKSLFCVPGEIKNPKELSARLAPILGLDAQTLAAQMTREKKFAWLKRKLSEQEVEAVRKLNADGLDFVEESRRVYPNEQMLGNVLGFADIDGVGREGVELAAAGYLMGKPGLRVSMKDAKGREIVSKTQESIPPVHGLNLQLTIDEVVQHIVERELDWGVAQFKPQGAMAVVLDVATGEILALASRPTFNPNHPGKSDAAQRRNRPVTDIFEPGSIYKIVAFAGALNERVMTPGEAIYCENGAFKIGRHTLNDTHKYGTLSMAEAFEKSSNIGTAKIALKLGADNLYAYSKAFGFGAASGIELPGEMPGILFPVRRWSGLSLYCLPMGQEVCANLIQLIRAYNVIASGGKLMKPRIFRKVFNGEGGLVKEWAPEVERQVLRPEVCRQITKFMKNVVSKEGTGELAAVPGYAVAGKTGTAQKPLKDRRGYSHEDFFASFLGFLPADNPRVCIGVVFDAPKPVYYGSSTAAPVFSRIAKSVMAYMGVAPTEKIEEETAK